MKLYSRRQVIFFSVLSGMIMLLFALGAGILGPRPAAREKSGEPEPSAGEQPGNDNAATVQTADYQYLPDTLLHAAADTVSYTGDERENITVYERLNSAVVNITTQTMSYNWFLEPVPREGDSGSGSIIDSRGYVLTNNHVIQNAIKVTINLSDGSQHEGTVVGIDPDTDLAVLKFEPPAGVTLQTIPYGDSGSLKVGQKVLAIGNPFGFERTLTVGIVSGLGRPIEITRNRIVRDMIQTDASINPGNSGGPLLDTRGRLIGINTMIASPSGASAGVGFAVPVNIAKRVITELMRYGKVRRGEIDARVVPLFPQLVSYAKLPVASGLLVSRTKPGGLAEKAGLRQGGERVQYGRSIFFVGGDIITSIGGIKTGSVSDLYSALENYKPGDKVKVEILRGQRAMTLDITLADREEW